MDEAVKEIPRNLTNPLRTICNYTSRHEENYWWWNVSIRKGFKEYTNSKILTRTRRHYIYGGTHVLRINYERSPEIGSFVKLTNAFCLLPDLDDNHPFYKTLSQDISEIPVIKTSISNCSIVGRLCAGNKHGLLVPSSASTAELTKLAEQLPDNVTINVLDDKLSALGNVIACNDKVALIHPELDRKSEEIIENTLQVEVFRSSTQQFELPGSYSVLNNVGGLVHSKLEPKEVEELSSILDLPLAMGTVNRGSAILGSGLIINDNLGYVGMLTTHQEIFGMKEIFKIQ